MPRVDLDTYTPPAPALIEHGNTSSVAMRATARGPIDGVFGSQTEAAVKAFQAERGITVDRRRIRHGRR